MAEAVPLGELLHDFMKRHSLALQASSTPRTLIPVWVLHISSSLGVVRPFTNKVEKG